MKSSAHGKLHDSGDHIYRHRCDIVDSSCFKISSCVKLHRPRMAHPTVSVGSPLNNHTPRRCIQELKILGDSSPGDMCSGDHVVQHQESKALPDEKSVNYRTLHYIPPLPRAQLAPLSDHCVHNHSFVEKDYFTGYKHVPQPPKEDKGHNGKTTNNNKNLRRRQKISKPISDDTPAK